MNPLTIAIDAMGGDHAPAAVANGAVLAAAAYPDVSLLLVGREDDIKTCLAGNGLYPGVQSRISILHAAEFI